MGIPYMAAYCSLCNSSPDDPQSGQVTQGLELPTPFTRAGNQDDVSLERTPSNDCYTDDC